MKKNYIKYDGWSGNYFFHPGTQKIIFFGFYHEGIIKQYGNRGQRIIFESIDLKNYNGPWPIPQIEDKNYVQVNSRYKNYELSFNISINKRLSKAELKLNKLPNLGEELITDTEKKGIELVL